MYTFSIKTAKVSYSVYVHVFLACNLLAVLLKFCGLFLTIYETKTLCNCQNKGLAALYHDGIASRLVAFSVYRPSSNPLQLFG